MHLGNPERRAEPHASAEAAGDGAATREEEMIRPLVASAMAHEQDIFVLQLAPMETLLDLDFIVSRLDPLQSFVRQFTEPREEPTQESKSAPRNSQWTKALKKVTKLTSDGRRSLNFGVVTKTLEDLIMFTTTATRNPDAITREGLPHIARQNALREQGFLPLAFSCVTVPFKTAVFMHEDLTSSSPGTGVAPLRRVVALCMRLIRHLIRDNPTAKKIALHHLDTLMTVRSRGAVAAIRVSDCSSCSERHWPN